MRSTNRFRLIWILALAPAGWCQSQLADASLEELLQVQVTSVSKKEQTLSKTAAAVFVINREDIRRSGALSLPDLLRMAPGVDVAQIDTNSWAVSIRGFNARYSDKVLVLVDGRSVYTSSFSGVFWEHLDMPLEDIERIEVIRGPGGTIWGANAMNGVINIITRSALATKGGLISAVGGNQVYASDALRYGAAAGNAGAYRAFAKYGHFGASFLPDHSSGGDGWTEAHGGFRADWDWDHRNSLMLEGELFSTRQAQTVRSSFAGTPFDHLYSERFAAAGGDFLAKWSHRLASGAELQVLGYYDSYRRTDLSSIEKSVNLDFELQEHLQAGARHDIVWGAGYRRSSSEVPPGYLVSLSPPSRTDSLYSAFLQDEMRVAQNLWLTLGAKLEHNSYTGFEYEPSARLAWTVSPRGTLWAAASRAIRQPSRLDTAIAVNLASFPVDAGIVETVRLIGNPHMKTETVLDFELGYRAQLSDRLSLDLASFFSSYHRLSTIEPGNPVMRLSAGGLEIVVPEQYENLGWARDFGGELSLNWMAARGWRLAATYSWMEVRAGLSPASRDTTSLTPLREAPQQKFQVRSMWNVTRKWEFDQTVSWTAQLTGTPIPAYTRLDARLGRRLGEWGEVGLVGQNLLRPGTLEFPNVVQVIGTLAERSVFGKVTWTF